MIPVTSRTGGQAQALRIGRLIFNHAHNNEHYGNIITYMRIKWHRPPIIRPPIIRTRRFIPAAILSPAPKTVQ